MREIMRHTCQANALLRHLVLAACLLLIAAGGSASAQSATASKATADEPMTVGVYALPPYAMQDKDGSWYGLGIDLLDALSRRIGKEYRLVESTPDAMVPDVAGGKLDMALGGVPINAADEAVIDFSVPYYSGDLGVALRVVDKIGPTMMFELLTSPAFLYMLGLLTGPVFVIGALIWLLERRANPEQFEPRPARGVFSGFWWATVTMTTVGYGDKAPVTFFGRLLAMAWMFAALILAAITTAQLAAGLTSSLHTNFVDNIRDLSGLTVGTITESPAAAELGLLNISVTSFDTVSAGLDALESHDIDALVYDRAILQWSLDNYRDLYLSNLEFMQQNYALILPLNDPARNAINIAILQTLESQQWHLILERYVENGAR
ncbi:MAG: hypothetical protein CMH13_13620 [Martelella sp.]|nr:hypothetical protein [Martelella sp.]